LTVKHDNRNQFELDPLDVYEYYFSNHKNIYFTNTYDKDNQDHLGIDEYTPSTTITPFVHQQDLKRFFVLEVHLEVVMLLNLIKRL
jgi:DEAD/DEAH box helicase domain-containing protein